MSKKFLFLTLITAVVCIPLYVASASRPAPAATTPEVWDEEAPEGEEPAIDEEDDVWGEQPNTPDDTSLESEIPDTAKAISIPSPAPLQDMPESSRKPQGN